MFRDVLVDADRRRARKKRRNVVGRPSDGRGKNVSRFENQPHDWLVKKSQSTFERGQEDLGSNT